MSAKRDPLTDPREGDEFTTRSGLWGLRIRVDAVDGERLHYVDNVGDEAWVQLKTFRKWCKENKPSATTQEQRADEQRT